MIQQFHWKHTPKRESRDSNRRFYASAHSSLIHNGWKVEATFIFTRVHRQVNGPPRETLVSRKRGHSDTGYTMNEPSKTVCQMK